MSKITSEWLKAAGIRAIKTMAQTALGMFTIGMAVNEVQWRYVISVTIVAGIYSVLTSLATNLPEVGSNGVLQVDVSDPQQPNYLLVLNDQEQMDKLAETKRVVFSVVKTISPKQD